MHAPRRRPSAKALFHLLTVRLNKKSDDKRADDLTRISNHPYLPSP